MENHMKLELLEPDCHQEGDLAANGSLPENGPEMEREEPDLGDNI